VVKLAPFNAEVLQHFIYLERPAGSPEPEGKGFEAQYSFHRGGVRRRLVPTSLDYDTVGEFYASLDRELKAFVDRVGESAAFCGDPALQLSPLETTLPAAKPVICRKTASHAFQAIVEQGEGAPLHSKDSHFQRFVVVREELGEFKRRRPDFSPSFPAAVNPVLRPPMVKNGRVWIEDDEAQKVVDLANAGYGLMLRLLAHSYLVPRPRPEKALAVDLSLALMRAVTLLGERAARLPAGPSHPECHAGMSFTALRDASAIAPGAGAARFFTERLEELAGAAATLAPGTDDRADRATRLLTDLATKARRGFERAASTPTTNTATGATSGAPATTTTTSATASATSSSVTAPNASAAANERGADTERRTVENGIERVEGKHLTLVYEGKKCIHSRFCVTWGPRVFLANVEGPWIHPDAMDVEAVAELAHVCPSGAIRYERRDGKPNEATPPVNLIALREAGPYAVRAEIVIDGEPSHFRATLCRCGASKNKPYCDGSHKEIGFAASGEPPTGAADMLPVRNGPLAIDPQTDGPLQVRGNLEITSGTGRVVARVTQARLCRCGGSSTKPFCDGTHARIGFRST
ncbi:MAG TPA: CDGSH iron-sulfur domain-containing protein, partial [Polyangiaceae bacterium]|nr:CDGSH iron-sulfur domain-containing protein [Polyangiaceae bacterium]